MVEFACEDKDIKNLLRRLHGQVTDNGGVVYDGLTIGCQNGSFTITCDSKKLAGKTILALPEECLLPVDRFTLCLDSDRIRMESHDAALSTAQVGMMETMLELYNRTDKIKQTRQTSTLGLYFEDRVLFDNIFQRHIRQHMPLVERMQTVDRANFHLDNFLNTRALVYKAGGPTTRDGENRQANVLMPIMDFLNHHPAAPPFLFVADVSSELGKERYNTPDAAAGGSTSRGLAVIKSCPFEGSDACHVSYGWYDAHDTFTSYNYVEQNANFVRSVPMQIRLPGGGLLKIMSQAHKARAKKLPEGVRDLQFYVPRFNFDAASHTLTLSSLIIPQRQAPRAMRRVLGLGLNRFGKDGPQLVELIKFVESRVIAENLRHYTALSDYLDRHETKPHIKQVAANAKEMARVQLEKVRKYPFLHEVLSRDSAAENE